MNPSSGVAICKDPPVIGVVPGEGLGTSTMALTQRGQALDDFDETLGTRLAALQASVSTPVHVPNLSPPKRKHVGLSLVFGTLLALVVAATAVGSVVLVSNLVRGYPGVESPGQPLAGANLECMTPPQAVAFLTGRGYRGVVWEVTPRVGAGYESASPPEHGYVVPGAIGADGVLHMVIDQRAGGGVGACYGKPMP